jgi:antitoxin component YwqK of YwqJK toxin-antitoxin module
MKHLFFILIGVVYLATAQAQNDNTRYLYGRDLQDIGHDSELPMVVKIIYSDTLERTFIYDPQTSKLLTTIRRRKITWLGKADGYAHLCWLPDSSFVYAHSDKQKISFDAPSQTINFWGKMNEKVRTIVFSLPKDSSVLATLYYKNGKKHSTAVYNMKSSGVGALQDFLYSRVSIFDDFHNILYTNSENQNYTFYYPNGNFYYNKKEWLYNEKTGTHDSTTIVMQDTMGAKIENWDNKTQKQAGKRFSFHLNGQIESIESYFPDGSGFIETTQFEEVNKTATSRSLSCDAGSNGVSYKKGDGNNMFLRETYNMGFNYFYFSNNSLQTPLFTIYTDTLGAYMDITLTATDQKWQKKTCPPTPAPIVEGWAKNIKPNGAVRVYYSDSLGAKKGLATLANFKNGLPDGIFVAFDKAGDTLASAVYTKGNLGYNKFYNLYLQTNFAGKYTADSIVKAQRAIDRRATKNHKIQHDWHTKDARNIWQRDTIIAGNVFSDGYNHFKKINTIYVVKEQLTPDSNSLVRLTYWYKNSPETPISTLLYHNTTKQIDSVALCFYSDSILHSQYNAFTHAYTTKGYSGTDSDPKHSYTIITMPSDSVRITLESANPSGSEFSLKMVDSFYHTPSFRTFVKNKLLPQAFVSTNYNAYEKALADYKKNGKFPDFTCEIRVEMPLQNPVYTTTNGREDDADGEKKYFFSDPTHERVDVKAMEKNLQNPTPLYQRNGVYYTKMWEPFEKKNYKNGLLEGEQKSFNPTDSTTVVTYYSKNKFLSDKVYNSKGRLVGISKKTGKNRLLRQFFDEKELIWIKEETFFKDTDFSFYENDIFYSKVYAQDSIKGRYLAFELKKINDKPETNQYKVQSWYASGQPHILYAYFMTYNAVSSFLQKIKAPKTAEYNTTKYLDDLLGEVSAFALLHENGNLWQQGSRVSRPMTVCEYDKNGKIMREVLPINANGKGYEYPTDDQKESCAWEHLPIQEGKMQNGLRVGAWRAYYRTAAKKLNYTLNYDENGLLDGLVAEYDSTGLPLYGYYYKKGVKQPIYNVYKGKDLIEASFLDGNKTTAHKKWNTNGVCYESIYQKNGAQYTINYFPNTNIVETKNIVFRKKSSCAKLSATLCSIFAFLISFKLEFLSFNYSECLRTR